MNRIGTYEIAGELGRGAMGVVYKAVDTMIGRTVAIKTIVFQVGSDPNAIAELRHRLFREAQSAGRLTHPGIVTIYQLGEDAGVSFIAMEFVEGHTLDHLASSGRSDVHTALGLLRQIAVALDYAHSKGVVHRDIKPANIMVTLEGATKITDFGIAKALGSTTLTQTGASLGTPFYMSPEQVQARMIDGRSDQFSLAVIAYRMLTGEKPFQADTMAGLMYKILHEQPPAPHHLNPDLGLAVERVFNKALAKSASDRFANCAAFVSALENACSGTIRENLAPLATMPMVTRRAKRTAVWVSIAAIAIVVAGIAWWLLRQGRQEQNSQSVASSKSSTKESAPTQGPLPTQGPAPTQGPNPTQGPTSTQGPPNSKTEPAPPKRDARVERASGTPATPLPTPVNPEKPPPQTVEVPRTPAEPPAWSTFHGNLQRNGFADVIGPQQQPHVVWKVELGGQLRGSPVIGRDGVAYVGSTDKNLYAVKNGAVLWSFPAEAPINETPAIVNGEILFRTVDRTLFHLTESGQLQSKTAQDGAAEYFAASHGVSYAAGGSAIRSSTGLVFQLGNPAATFPVIGRTGQVCAGDTAGNLTCFDASGERKWSYQADGRITSTPAITPEGDLIFGCADRNVYCVREGQLRWKFLTGGPVYSAPVYDRSGVIFVGSNDGHVYAIGAQGQERWRIDLGNEVRSSPAFDRNGGIYVSSINRRLFYLK